MTPTDEHGIVLCPLCDPDEPWQDRILHVRWTTSTDLYAEFVGDSDAVDPAQAHSQSWEIGCNGGHVIAIPSGDDVANEDTSVIKADDWQRLVRLLNGGSSDVDA